MKKILYNIVVIAAALLICWQIGQHRGLRNIDEDIVEQENGGQAIEETNEENVNNAVARDVYDILAGFTSSKDTQTEDNPWGVLVGVLESEDLGKFLLLTAGNDLGGEIVLGDNAESLEFDYTIHPWVNNEQTDGAELVVTLTSGGDKTLQEKFEIMPMMDEQHAKIDISSFADQTVNLRLEGFGGADGDLTNDWIILSNFELK